MNKFITIVMVLVTFGATVGQAQKQVDSKIAEVTVFLNRAQVTRNVKTKVEAGKTELVISSLSSELDPRSIQVSGKGSFTILGVSHRQNFLNDFNSPTPLKIVKDSLQYYHEQIQLEQSMKEILNKEEQFLMSNQKIGGANQTLSAAEIKAVADFYRSRMNEIVFQKMKHDARIKKLQERHSKLQRQHAEMNDLFGRNTSEIIVNVSAESATPVDLEVKYVVANAGWTPVYDVRASDTKGPVDLHYKANVFQRTGEEWKNVRLTLSTINAQLSGTKPELATWYVDFYQPVVRRPASVMKQRAVTQTQMEVAAPEMEENASSVSDYTDVVQTTLSTEFKISLPYTISSSSKPTLVDIARHTLRANYAYAVAPKIDPDAFLMAKISGWDNISLLSGEANVFFEGTFVSKTTIDASTLKDTLSISLGRDKRVVVKREKLQDFTTRKTIGSNQRDAYAYSISIRNTKSDAIKLLVEDQLPVSQNNQIEVSIIDLAGAKHTSHTGKIEWEINLLPQGTKTVVYKYEIKYPKEKVISNLF